MRSKRKKVLIVLGVLAVAAVCFVMLLPPDEPKYRGRYLSEWMARYERNRSAPEGLEAEQAVQTIGTNALPYFLEWLRYEPSPLRESFLRKLPSRIRGNRTVHRWISSPLLRARYAYLGIGILGTNAFVAMPELEAMMRDSTKPQSATVAVRALSEFGEPALPLFQAAIDDPHQADRDKILVYIAMMAPQSGTNNKYLPVFVAALTNDDAVVRQKATNVVNVIAPEVFTTATNN